MYPQNRRSFLCSSLAAAVLAAYSDRLLAQTDAVLQIASAGSVAPLLNGPVRKSVAETLHTSIAVHSQGADAVAKALVSGTLKADVFIPITAAPMRTVLSAGLADVAVPIARTEMV